MKASYEKSGGMCWSCGQSPCAHEEHLTLTGPPHHGSDHPDNLVDACEPCNHKKAGQRIQGGPAGGYNWNLVEFRTVVGGRLRRPREDVAFYGEQYGQGGAAPLPLDVPEPSVDERKGYVAAPTCLKAGAGHPQPRGGPFSGTDPTPVV